MTSDDDLRRIFEETAALKAHDQRDQLAYRHMIALADHFDVWALDEEATREEAAELMGRAENMRQLAELVGPEWDPPRPEHLSFMGFLARRVLGEE
jgi:hypothetical protein